MSQDLKSLEKKVPKQYVGEFRDIYNAVAGAMLSRSTKYDERNFLQLSAIFFLREVLKLDWSEVEVIYEKEYGLGLLYDRGTRAQIGRELSVIRKRILETLPTEGSLAKIQPQVETILEKKNDFAEKYIDKILKLESLVDIVADALTENLEKEIKDGSIETADLLKIYSILSTRLVETSAPIIEAVKEGNYTTKRENKQHTPADAMQRVLEVYDQIKG